MEDTSDCPDQYLQIAEDLGIFHKDELRILAQVVSDYQHAKDGYILLEEKRAAELLGYVIFGRIPITTSGWDIYWLVVRKDCQGKGIGRKLLKRIEEHILCDNDYANIRVETSTRKEYAHARNLYVKAGYQEVGSIADFYDRGDNVVIFYKRISHGGESSGNT